MKRVLSLLLALCFMLVLVVPAYASVAKFGTTGSGSNPFNPRGYFVELTDGSKYWLSSKFSTPSSATSYDSLGHQVQYTGSESGLDYIEAEKISKLYTVTDRNPTPGHQYLFAYKKKAQSASLSAVSSYQSGIQTPGRYGVTDPNGDAGWTIPVNFTFEPGTLYEFGYLRGMQANNGISCVIAEDNSGYIKTPFTSEELARYDSEKNNEYKYLTSASLVDGEWVLTFVPMRYKIQTYADTSAWDPKADEAQEFLDSITPSDISSGKYKQENVEALENLLEEYNDKAENVLKKKLQDDVDASITQMKTDIDDAIEKVKNEKAGPSDITEYKETLKKAKTLYNDVKDKIGTTDDMYGREQVVSLKAAIDDAISAVGDVTITTSNVSQLIIDQHTQALKRAITAVKASKVIEGEIRFYDSTTGITVIAQKASLPENVRLYVGQIVEGETIYKNMLSGLDRELESAVLYEIRFYVGQVEVSPTETVVIQIPTNTENDTYICTVDGDGASTYIDTVVTESVQIFETDEMGFFSLLTDKSETPKDEKEKEKGPTGQSNEKTEVIKKTENEEDKQQEINEVKEEEQKTEDNKERENKDRVQTPPKTEEIDIESLSREIDSDALVYVGAGVAVFGVLCGGFEFIRSKREDDLFV